MGEMMERIARAIRGKPGAPYVNGMTEGDSMIAARAAVEALREPSPTMMAAAVETFSHHAFHPEQSTGPEATQKAVWQSAIDALLTEGGRTGEGG